ncbi:phosphoribosylformylglycinamidine synthase [Collinsella tanakaei]|uniref:Phosphoribosylformylglycinamidine synthase n=1 Tax=Collinsella tanakaei TaxID=626935 RepID=A0A3E4QY78_9ACTN|nr:phosphoribosylformylglycinamidine synthase [Collinsella tanakaei]RGL12125.1 phosphoribosylformylglycinamidine synthase [Collinsella tanakaei]
MVSRVYVEKKPGFDVEAQQLKSELVTILGVKGLDSLRLINRYDVEGADEDLFRSCVPTVFSEPQVDFAYDELPAGGVATFAVEFLPGQFDQRADSASECIQLISQGERPTVRSAKVYILDGELSDEDVEAIKRYVVNPVEARLATLELPETLTQDVPEPEPVEIIDGFRELDEAGLAAFIAERGLAMDEADIAFCQQYFKDEDRDPTITEIRVIDTYWSDHCRHTTFGTVLENIEIDDSVVQAAFDRYMEMRHELGRDEKPVCLMDMGTIGAKWLKAQGILTNLDESEEINACTVKVTVDVDGEDQDWLFLFKNETHNHPTEIEPFGGAATCVGGAIRDPLSGRSYVYQAMRVTGAADPTVPVSATIAGKLPQRKLVTTAAAGYSSYGNQIGLATGQVSELYHPGYMAKRMEVGAVVGATPASHVRRECPAPGDKIILLGGRTGRDGIGGATGSSKAHNVESIEKDGAEVQKGNAPMERKLQRLFRRGDACRLIKRCNDFGAGGVSVAVGELADGLYIDLDMVTKKYDGLDGTELAISESQERMAVAVAEADVDEFMGYAAEENLEATVIAEVTCEPRVRMAWQGDAIVDLSREFLNSNGAPKFQDVHVPGQGIAPIDPESELAQAALEEFGSLDNVYESTVPMVPGAEEVESFEKAMRTLVSDLNVCSNKGLSERFDSTIGAATVLMPFGGTRQLTPAQAMVAKFPVDGETTTVSGMAWGFNPYIMEADQFRGAYLSVVESIARLVATGFDHRSAYLSFQEYFERLRDVPERWGKPMAAVLGALMAQVDLGAGAIGGKDSMSGSFEDLDVPPTLVSFAVAVDKLANVVSPEFKVAGSRVALIQPAYREDDLLPQTDSLLSAFGAVEGLVREGKALSVSTAGFGGLAEILFKACLGNKLGFQLSDAYYEAEGRDLFDHSYGCFVVELAEGTELPAAEGVEVIELGCTTQAYEFTAYGETLDMEDLQEAWVSALEGVFPYRSAADDVDSPEELVPEERYRCEEEGRIRATYGGLKIARPRVVIPVFPGNNCEYDSARAFRAAGAEADIFVINNLTPENVAESTRELARRIRESQIVMIPGGFSGGDEPDGSAKFITAFFRAPEVTEAVRDLLQARDGLMLGICNGFQALIKLGLVPYGDIVDATADAPTLTFNQIGRHQSRLVRTRICSDLSPWLTQCDPDELYTVAISHGEGRFVANDDVLSQLREGGQIATQYVDVAGMPSMDLDVNPNGSVACIEGIISPDGRVFGKMGHVERRGDGLYKNVPGDKFMPLFESGVAYFA